MPLAAVGALAVCGATLAMVGSDTRLLRLGVSCSLAATVSVTVLLRARERDHAREAAENAAAHRREEAHLQNEVEELDAAVERLTGELASVRKELAEVTVAHSAALLARVAPAPAALSRDEFLEGAAALGDGPESAAALESAALESEPVDADSVEAGPAVRPMVPEPPLELRPIELASIRAFRNGTEQRTDEPELTEAAADPAAGQPDSEPAPAEEERTKAKVIDLTAHDDTQPLHIPEIRKRA
jgi:hypothetical protein